MIPNRTDWRLQDDTRAVAPLLGAILLFGFLVIGLSIYQAQVIPQQNAETEFEHFEDNRNELIELRDDISRAGEFNRARFPTVQLGTTYRTRTVGINGPPPAGLLQTSDPYPINITNEDGDLVGQPQTRFIEYRPSYNEIDIGSTWYEHSVLYLDERDNGGGLSIIREQEIVDGEEVTVTALQNPFQETGTRRVTLEVYPTNDFNQSDIPTEGELKVSIPTRLDDYWNKTLADAGDTFQDVDTGVHGKDVHELNLNVDANNLRVNTVGIKSDPDEDPVTNIDQFDDDINYKIESFDNVDDHEWNVPEGVTEVDVLVVGGGGGGAANTDYTSAGGGGGGAGGLVFASDYDVNPGDTIGLTVGDGGDGIDQEGTPADNGDNSTFDDLTAIGGGGGILTGGGSDQDTKASDGGSGGGGRQNPPGEGTQPNTNPNAEDFGNDGSRNSNDDGGGGGGGAGEEPDDINGNDGGKGGDGLAKVSYNGETYRFADVFGTDYGEQNNGDVYFAGGGGGGGDGDGELGGGGLGGGGDGGSDRDGIEAEDGRENTGGGGGGGTSGTNNAEPGGDGGSGVVIIRWSE